MRTEDDAIINDKKLMNKILPELPAQKFAVGITAVYINACAFGFGGLMYVLHFFLVVIITMCI